MALSKWVHSSVQDGGTDVIQAATSVQEVVCKGGADGTTMPTTRAEVLGATFALAIKASGITFTGQTGAAGASRVLAVDAQAGVSVTASGDAKLICIIDGTNILAITTCATQTLTSGNTVDIPAWNITVAQPT